MIEKPHAVPGSIHGCGINWGKIVKNLAQPEKKHPNQPKIRLTLDMDAIEFPCARGL